MTVNLDKDDLISLVKGVKPSWTLMETLENQNLGRYSDINGWHWDDSSLSALDEVALFTLYKNTKNSWNERVQN